MAYQSIHPCLDLKTFPKFSPLTVSFCRQKKIINLGPVTCTIKFWWCGKKWAWRSRFISDTVLQILVVWVTISVWPFSVSQHHLLYSSIPQEESQHVLLGMVQHFVSHVRQRQFFCFVRPKQGSKDLINSSFGGLAWQHSAPCILTRKAKYLSLHNDLKWWL
jgi:hypothetical protein